MPLAHYRPYYDARIPFTVLGGTLGAAGRYRLARDSGGMHLSLGDLGLRVDGPRLRLGGASTDFFRATAVALAKTSVDLDMSRLDIGEFSVSRAQLEQELSLPYAQITGAPTSMASSTRWALSCASRRLS